MHFRLAGAAALLCSTALVSPLQAQVIQTATNDDALLGDVTVVGQRDAVVAGKADIPLLETPQAISVVSADDIQARGVTRLAEALTTVAGVSRSSTYGFYDAYTIRGFDAAYGSVYLDGLVNEAGVGFNQELSALEQIEVLKGPASMLFGQAPLGGLINLVSKRPSADPFATLGASTGSWDLIEATVDANGALSGDKTVMGRLNLVYRDQNSFVRNAATNRIFVAPALTWRPNDDTSLTFLGRYQRDKDNPISPVPAYGTVLPGVVELPEDFAVNNGGDQKVINNHERWQVGYVFDHRFSEALTLSQTLRYTHREEYWDRWMFAAGFLDENGDYSDVPTTTIGRYYYGPYETTDKDLAVDTRLKGVFATGSIGHEWLAGVDYRRSRGDYYSAGDYDPAHFPLDLLNPDYDAVLDTSSLFGEIGSNAGEQTGVYIQDHLTFGEFATLTIGGRYDWAEANGQKDDAFSPRIGATVRLVEGLNAYASWSKSFVPQLYGEQIIDYDADGNPIGGPLPPEEGRNVELGLKFAPETLPVSGSLAIYELIRQNVATADPVYPIYSVVTGEQRSRGFEVEGHWQPTTALGVDLAYSYVDAEVTEDNFFTVGAPLPNVPKHNIGAFARYEVQDGPLAGFGATLGVSYNSKRNGDIYSTRPDGSVLIWLPEYTLVDAGVSYRREDWSLQLTVANLLDERYWPDTGGLDRVTPGTPRNWRLTLSRTF
jgi:iron complex outermembrane recepter protein